MQSFRDVHEKNDKKRRNASERSSDFPRVFMYQPVLNNENSVFCKFALILAQQELLSYFFGNC